MRKALVILTPKLLTAHVCTALSQETCKDKYGIREIKANRQSILRDVFSSRKDFTSWNRFTISEESHILDRLQLMLQCGFAVQM